MSLIFLVLLTLLGLSTFGVSVLEERMSGNARDRIRAFQATEAALRDCETFVAVNNPTFNDSSGMYQPAAAGADPRWKESDIWSDSRAKTYGNGIALVASQPRCIAEQLPSIVEPPQVGRPTSTPRYRFYRVTARGTGASNQTVVMLQTTLKLLMVN